MDVEFLPVAAPIDPVVLDNEAHGMGRNVEFQYPIRVRWQGYVCSGSETLGRNLMFSSNGQASDGRAIVEVESLSFAIGTLTLAGSACVFEGNLIFEITNEQGYRELMSTQASAAGPERGTWILHTKVEVVPFQIRVGDEDASTGGFFPPSIVHLVVADDGLITEMPIR